MVSTAMAKSRPQLAPRSTTAGCLVFLALALAAPAASRAAPAHRSHTVVAIRGDDFYINGHLTYAGRSWQGHSIAGLLFNSRMVQGIFDDLDSATVATWAYPDTGRWDPDRNTAEFIAAMPDWRRHGLLAFTLNLQGGSPTGYSRSPQPLQNSAFTPDGSLRPAYMARLGRILDRADQLGMVVILGYFYVGQVRDFTGEDAVIRASDNASTWLLTHGYRNVLVEIANETGSRFPQPILRPDRIAELIARTRKLSVRHTHLLAGTSFGGGVLPNESVVAASDFVLIHGNGVSDPQKIGQLVRDTRAVTGYTAKPILFNEDDHFAFDQPLNNMTAALAEHASWGYFDYRMAGEDPADGFQSVPVDWTIDSPRKLAFFHLLAEITGSAP
jgi:hypothetical protein